MTKERLLQEFLPYRMKAVDIFNYALRLRAEWPDDPPPSTTMHVAGKLIIEQSKCIH
jgi:hypothetical protein